MRTPTWEEFREFLEHDGWELVRATDHDHFRKTLPDGEILRTSASRATRTSMSPGRFRAILSYLLRISADEFWEVLRTKTAAQRPSPAPEAPPASLPRWLAVALEREAGLSSDQIATVDEVEGRRLLDEARSQPRDQP